MRIAFLVYLFVDGLEQVLHLALKVTVLLMHTQNLPVVLYEIAIVIFFCLLG